MIHLRLQSGTFFCCCQAKLPNVLSLVLGGTQIIPLIFMQMLNLKKGFRHKEEEDEDKEDKEDKNKDE